MSERTITVASRALTVDLICWRHYKAKCAGMTERVLEANPGLAAAQLATGFLPLGLVIVLPDLDASAPRTQPPTLWD